MISDSLDAMLKLLSYSMSGSGPLLSSDSSKLLELGPTIFSCKVVNNSVKLLDMMDTQSTSFFETFISTQTSQPFSNSQTCFMSQMEERFPISSG